MFQYAVIAQLILTLILMAVRMASPVLFDGLTQEDGLIEWLTAILFVCGGVSAGLAARHARRRQAPWIATTGLALLCLVLAVAGMEEISWGQRIFALNTPESLREVNQQEEINLHNLNTGLTQKVSILGSFLFGTGFPAACLFSAWIRRQYEERLHLRAPSPLIAVPCLLGYALCNPAWLLPTLVLGLTYACCGALTVALASQSGPRRTRTGPLVLGAGILTALLVQAGQDAGMAWTNGSMELGEACFAVAAFLLAFSTLGAPGQDV
jgi:hypothetical protein